MTYDAFISYAPQDAEQARWLAQRLAGAGLRVASEEVLRSPGAVIVETIERGIRDAAHGILLFSRAAMTDAWVKEAYATLMRRSIEGGQRFIPVLIEDVELPEFAANRYVVDLSHLDGPDHDRQVADLVAALRDSPPVPPVLLVRPGTGVRPEKPLRALLPIAPGHIEPLVLHPRVDLFRTVSGGAAAASMNIPGPLRILVALASPSGPAALLDLEAELAKILDSVQRARRGSRAAYVRILNE